jgi:hypothetical protein
MWLPVLRGVAGIVVSGKRMTHIRLVNASEMDDRSRHTAMAMCQKQISCFAGLVENLDRLEIPRALSVEKGLAADLGSVVFAVQGG